MLRSSSSAQHTPVLNPIISSRSRFCGALLALTLFVAAVAPLSANAGAPVPRFAYVLDQTANSIEIFTQNLNTGALVKTVCAPNPQPLPAGAVADTAKVDPTGSFLYVTDRGLNQVIGYSIAPNGCLALILGGVLPTVGLTPSSIHISADGQYLYVADTCGGVGCVEGFFINPNGTLAPVGPPQVAGLAQGGIAIDPVRQYFYATDPSPGGGINGSQYNPFTGILNPWAFNFAHSPNPHRMALDAVGNGLAGGNATQFLLVQSDAGPVIDCYTLNTAGGGLAWAGAAAAGPNPHSVGVTPFGQFAYVTNNVAAGTVTAFNVNNCAGIAVNGAAVVTGANPTGLSIDATGKFVYVAATGANQVWGYKINEVTGALVKVGAWATGLGPVHVATMP